MKMKKRLSLLLMLVCLVFGLTACGNDEKKLLIDINDATSVGMISQICEILFNQYYGTTADEIAMFQDLNDDDLEYISESIRMNTGIRMEGKAFVEGMNSYTNALDEIGSITSIPGIADVSEWEVKEDSLIVSYYLNGTLHNGSMEFIFDKNLHVASVTTNVEYSMSELMAKAGINTALGMGTVFVMLIVISIIISMFSVIPKIQKSFEKKPESSFDNSVDKVFANIVEREEAEAEDDLELIAVIAAAIAASEGASSTDGFVVRSIKRIR